MVNIQLASPTPPSSTAATTTVASNPIMVQVTVTDVPATLDNLLRAIQTNALPMGTLEGNNLQLSTALGNVTVALAQKLALTEKQSLTQQLINLMQTSRPLTLTLQPGSPPTQGTLLVPTLPTPAQSALPPGQPASAPAPLAPQTLSVGNTFSAIVLPTLPKMPPPVVVPPALHAPAAYTAPPFFQNAGTSASQTSAPYAAPQAPLPSPVLGDGKAVQNAPAALSAPMLALTPAAPLSAAPALPSASALLAAGNEVSLHINAVLPDFSANSGKMPPLAPNQILATVTGTGTGGQIILKAEEATLFVKSQAAAPVGTSVIVTVAAAQSAPLVTIPESSDAKFSALPEALAALREGFPQVFQSMMASHIPQPNEALPGALLFLFSAFKQCNVRDWLGNESANRLVDMGKGLVLRSLSKDLSEAGQPVHDTVVGEWRAYPIPLYAHQQFQSLTLYVHGDRRERKNPSESAPIADKIRFLIDMKLSKLGAMQVDGFVQPQKMDMILRSESMLPEGLHQELRTSYLKALGAVGYAGTLHFQVGRQHWMVMQKPAPKGIVT